MDDKQKMNDLAHTLRKHGLAASSSDAIRLANNVESTQEDNNQVHKKNFGDDLTIKSSPTQGLGGNKMQDTLSKEQIISVLQQFSDKFCAEINTINSKLQNLEASMAGPTVNEMMKTTDKPAQQMPAEEPEQQMPAEEPAQQMPAEEPEQQMPAEEPVQQMPAEEPVQQMPAEEPVQQMPAEEPVQQMPAEEPVQQMPAEEPVQQMPAEEPAQQMPAEEPAQQMPEKPKNPQDDMMESVDLVDTFNVNKK